MERTDEFMSAVHEPCLRLDPDSLFSKFGFNDGDVPDAYDEWRARQGLDPVDWVLGGDWHEILDELVRTRLLPLLDHKVEAVTVMTSHNPVRAAFVDDHTAEEYESLMREARVADLQPEFVDVPYADVEKVLRRTENGLFPLAEAVAATARSHGLTPRQIVELRAIATSMLVTADDIQACGLILAGERGGAIDPDDGQRASPQRVRTLAAHRAAELAADPHLVPRTYDLEHWARIHRHLFHDTDEAAGVVRPGVNVGDQLDALRNITPETASRTLAEVVPVMVEARPFTSSVLHAAGNISSLRVLIQHALARVGLSIDWKWFGHDGEAYQTAADLGDLFDLAVS